MRPWHGLLLAALVAGVLAVAPVPRVVQAAEVDALAAGARLATSLTRSGDAGLRPRLEEGFWAGDEHPHRAALRGEKAWRVDVAVPPVPRWVSAAAIMVGPERARDLGRARWAAALTLALAGVLLGSVLARWAGASGTAASVGWGVLGVALVIVLPGALDAGTTAGAAATGALASALLLVTLDRLVRLRKGALAVGLAWGLALGVHPGALFLLVPVFAAVAVAWRPEEAPPRDPGLARLPTVPVLLLAAPVVGVLLLVAAWPTLWEETGERLAAWLTNAWWLVAPRQDVAGQVFDQPGGRAPQAWTALVQWAAWTPIPVLLAWAAGLVETVRRGRDGAWSPILLLATLLVVGGMDGGLFGARLTLWPWLWAPTALTAGIGVAAMARALTGRATLRPRLAAGALGGAIVAAAVIGGTLLGGPPTGVGATARVPIPLAELREMARVTPGAPIHVASGTPGYGHGIEVLRRHAGLDLRWAGEGDPVWIIVLDDGSGVSRGLLKGRLAGREPTWRDRVAGVPMEAHRVR
ncbi:MAG: hypothetical protein ACQEXJ_13615 [Myxococcota bacterium]